MVAPDRTSLIRTFDKDHCSVCDFCRARGQSQSFTLVLGNGILSLKASFVVIGDSLDFVLITVGGKGVDCVFQIVSANLLAVGSTIG